MQQILGAALGLQVAQTRRNHEIFFMKRREAALQNRHPPLALRAITGEHGDQNRI
jgi:hypothetical protein